MGRRWKLVAVVVAGAAALGGCNRGRRVLDPGGAVLPLPDGGVSADAVGGANGDGGSSTGSDAGGTAASDGGPTTQRPTSACAASVGRPPVATTNPAVTPSIMGCRASLPVRDSMVMAAAADGQKYTRCRTVGPETSWRVTLSPDGSRLAARTSAGTVRLYRTDVWTEIAQIASPVGMLDAIAFSPDGTRLAALSSEMGQVTLWNAADGALQFTFDGPPVSTIGNPASALAFSSDGRRLATSLGTVIDLQTRAMTNTYTGKPAGPYVAQVNPAGDSRNLPSWSTGSMRFVGCDQRVLVKRASAQGMLGWVDDLALVDPVAGVSAGLAGDIWSDVESVVASPDGRWAAFITRGNQAAGVSVYDAAEPTRIAFDPNPHVSFVAGFSPSGDRLIVVTGTTIQVRAIPTYRLLSESALPLAGPYAAFVSPRGEVIISANEQSIWLDPATGAIRRRVPFQIANPSFTADGRYGVSDGTGAALFHLWREDEPFDDCAPAAAPPEAAIAGIALSQDGKTLATADRAGTVQLRAVSEGGDVGRGSATIVSGVAADYYFGVSVAVANGGGRIAVQGSPPGAATMPTLEGKSRVVVVDAANPTPLLTRTVKRSSGRLALSPDGAWVAFQDGTTEGGTLNAVPVDTAATALSFPVSAQIDSFSPDSKLLAMSGTIWELATGNLVTTYALDGTTVAHLGLSPDWSVIGGVQLADPWAGLVWHPGDASVISRLGTYMTVESPLVFDTSGAIVATFLLGTHTLGTNWTGWHVWSVADGTEQRVFAMSSSYGEPLLVLSGGARLLTRAGSALAAWCR